MKNNYKRKIFSIASIKSFLSGWILYGSTSSPYRLGTSADVVRLSYQEIPINICNSVAMSQLRLNEELDEKINCWVKSVVKVEDMGIVCLLYQIILLFN